MLEATADSPKLAMTPTRDSEAVLAGGMRVALHSSMTTPSNDDCRPPPKSAAPAPHGLRAAIAASAGSVVSAFLASVCCVGPLVFALLGLGGAGLLVKFEPYRPYFMAVTFALLGAGFYFTYRRPRLAPTTANTDGAACDCPAPRTNRAGRIMLWVATASVVGFLGFPYLVPLLFS